MTTKSEKPLRIVALTAENVKRLTAVHIEPQGNVVQITGRNRQGKTSVLDAIWWAIEGASHIQASPIHKGADKARIRLDLGEILGRRSDPWPGGWGRAYDATTWRTPSYGLVEADVTPDSPGRLPVPAL